MGAVFLLIIIAGLVVAGRYWIKKQKRDRLMAKYGDEFAVKRIMAREVWEGMTREQLLDALGSPVETDERSSRTKVLRTYKYQQTGKNRFKLRVTLENDVVAGWQKR